MINLQPNEKILYEKSPGSGMLGYWFLTKVLGFGFLILLVFGWFPLFFSLLLKKSVPGLIYYVIALILILVLKFIYTIFLIKSHKYIITNKRVYAEAGIISRRQRSIDFNKITDTTIHQNIFERMFHVSNLGIQTAGMRGRPEITFLGIEDTTEPQNLLRKIKK